MIKLTLHNGSESTTHPFDKEVVVIGYGSQEYVDLVLDDDSLKAEHVKIVQETDRFVVYNSANDPFVALNGLPFAKQRLNSGDILEVGRGKLYFEGKIPQPIEESVVSTPKNLESLEPEVSRVMNRESPPQEEKPPIKKATQIIDEEDEEEPPKWEQKKEEPHEAPPLSQPLSPEQRWRLLLRIVIPCLLIVVIVGTFSYLRFSGKSQEQEEKAVKGLADIGMALTYAQVNHLKPVQQHWANPQFLEAMFNEVLAAGYPSLAKVDSQGNFKNTPYILRIYTSNDSTKFVAIAQPAPSLLQWLIPKSAIIIDSSTMRMHRIANLKAINRLLVNANTLDDLVATQIAAIVGKSPSISMASLVDPPHSNGFNLPEHLTKTKTREDELIYNAPRYYPMGAKLLEEASKLQQGPASSVEVAQLQQKVEALANLKGMILYSPKGEAAAEFAHQALSTFAPLINQEEIHFHVGYLKLDGDGIILSSHLLGDPIVSNEQDNLIAEASPGEQKDAESIHTSTDPQHPLYLKLIALLKERRQQLQPIGQQISQLVQDQVENPVPEFQEHLSLLVTELERLSQEQDQQMAQSLSALYHEYANIPLSTFMAYTKAAGLHEFIEKILKIQKGELGEHILTEEGFATHLEGVQEAMSFRELAENVSLSSRLLNLEHLPNTETLILYQGQLRQAVLSRLNDFLLSPDSPLSEDQLHQTSPRLLRQILKEAWVEDPDEVDYYITELNWHLTPK